jgi:hypothetical protein
LVLLRYRVSASFSDGPFRADAYTDELASAFVVDFTDPMARPCGLPDDGSEDAWFHVSSMCERDEARRTQLVDWRWDLWKESGRGRWLIAKLTDCDNDDRKRFTTFFVRLGVTAIACYIP